MIYFIRRLAVGLATAPLAVMAYTWLFAVLTQWWYGRLLSTWDLALEHGAGVALTNIALWVLAPPLINLLARLD